MRDLLPFESARLIANKAALPLPYLTLTFEELSFRELAAITFPSSSLMTSEATENFGLTATLKLAFRKPEEVVSTYSVLEELSPKLAYEFSMSS
jgi:hypothetical protein